ncbi:AmmeMemoRadiSam system radical SAM enzyme [Candidatus Woesearchaeota archaeon CG08_land_8_20_14_0_20_47_9]|nr:MAG: AmmeMemoRadiSam system radical SAM enzyme [Candidatus Woesearchaeota archaeon CG1_02_47_18]PIO04274.1 MAG: AmmeMemoRadiSam system radical SAM enzyme [Candidatus Woesearchaeota archaeon CG08_land_8_20_14_0_20_47_9]HII30358.1 AmmeMemoRadiSam system radical SAM enzyme [Candidatus Woesearchaeota archaeon]
MHDALYYDKKGEGIVCNLCPHLCTISGGKTGFCGVRKNVDGVLKSLVYGRPVAVNADPIEKKPLYHFLPGSKAFSIGTVGCNLACLHCQNWDISRARPRQDSPMIAPDEIVRLALDRGCKSVSYTYNEPTVFYEYMTDIAGLARKKGLKNVIVSNGFINPEPLNKLCRLIDAANIDLKAFDDSFYKTVCSGRLEPVLDSLKIIKAAGVWLEVTNLIIPGRNSDKDKIRDMCRWITKALGIEVPLHFTAFYPCYKMTDINATPASMLEEARRIALDEGIKYVYVGNVYSAGGGNTYCPECKALLVERIGYGIRVVGLKDGCCGECGARIAGVWG